MRDDPRDDFYDGHLIPATSSTTYAHVVPRSLDDVVLWTEPEQLTLPVTIQQPEPLVLLPPPGPEALPRGDKNVPGWFRVLVTMYMALREFFP